MHNLVTDRYFILIDTDRYSGGFCRELCAYTTGQYGECGVGQDISEKYSPDIVHWNWWLDNIIPEWDPEDNVLRPAQCSVTPGWFNNGVGGNFRDIPENHELAISHAVEFRQKQDARVVQTAQQKLLEQDFDNYWTPQFCQDQLIKAKENIDNAKILSKFPAYQSVEISVRELPEEQVWQEFIQRTHDFCLNYPVITHATSPAPSVITFRRRKQVTFDVD